MQIEGVKEDRSGREEIDGLNPSSVAWLSFCTTGPIITLSSGSSHSQL